MSSVRSARSGTSDVASTNSVTSQPHASRPVKRSPSKQYRKIIAAEVASGDDYTFHDQRWTGDLHSPVRLIHYKTLPEHRLPVLRDRHQRATPGTDTRTHDARPVVSVHRQDSDASRATDVVYGHPYDEGERSIKLQHQQEKDTQHTISASSDTDQAAYRHDDDDDSITSHDSFNQDCSDVMNGFETCGDRVVITSQNTTSSRRLGDGKSLCCKFYGKQQLNVHTVTSIILVCNHALSKICKRHDVVST